MATTDSRSRLRLTPAPSRHGDDDARLESMATTKYNPSYSSIGKVSSRSERLGAGALGTSSAGARMQPRFRLAAGGDAADDGAGARHEARRSAAHSRAAGRVNAGREQGWQSAREVKHASSHEEIRAKASGVLDRLQERVASANRSLIIFGMVAVNVAVCVTMLYGPLREYYVSRRTNEYLAQRLEQLERGNERVEADLRALQTREGIEDEARRRGYVEDGAVAVNVVGLPEGIDSQATGADAAFITYEERESPWYEGILDVIFQYSPPTTAGEGQDGADEEPEVKEPEADEPADETDESEDSADDAS